MKHVVSVVLGVLVAAGASMANAADRGIGKKESPAPPKLKVALTVSGNPKVIHATHSHIAAALRKIEDIEISKDQPAFQVVCMVTVIDGTPEKMAMAITTSTSVRLQVVE